MSKQRRALCRECGASGNDTHISQSGLCGPCGDARLKRQNDALISKSGPEYDRWRAGLLQKAPDHAARMGIEPRQPQQ
jgi:hypothetical protein